MASIDQRVRKDGTKSWKVAWRLGGSRTGEWQSITVDSSRADAEKVAAFAKAHGHTLTADQVRAQIDPQHHAEPVTVAAWCKRYAESLTGIQPATRAEYVRIVDQHIATAPLGRLTPAEVTREHVRLWVQTLEAKHSPKTISNYHAVLSAALGEAANIGMLTANPCRGIRLPRRDDHTTVEEHCYLTATEVALIADELPQWCRHIPHLLARTGLRWSEFTALQVGDIDLLATPPTLSVARAWKRQKGGTYAVGTPKTRKSRRTITLDRMCVDILAGLTAGRAAADWVVTGPDGHSPLPRSTFVRHWRAALYGPRPKPGAKSEPGGLVGTGMLEKRPRIHDLRHTHASWLLDDPMVSMYRLQRRMGHESITTTEGVYGHLRQDGDTAILDALDRVGEPTLPRQAGPAERESLPASGEGSAS